MTIDELRYDLHGEFDSRPSCQPMMQALLAALDVVEAARVIAEWDAGWSLEAQRLETLLGVFDLALANSA